MCNRPTSFSQLLSGADTALRAAQQAGKNSWRVDILAEESEAGTYGQQQWKKILTESLADNNIVLFFSQPFNPSIGPRSFI